MKPRILLSAFALLILTLPALATWSIVVVNTRTGEVCVSTATCIPGDDIKKFVPVIVPGFGAGAAQSATDLSGVNRMVIWDGLHQGLSPDDILALLAQNGGHQQKQYGIPTCSTRR